MHTYLIIKNHTIFSNTETIENNMRNSLFKLNIKNVTLKQLSEDDR